MNAINVRALGAVGNGNTLDSPAIQKALDKVAVNGGGTVVVPPGIYRIGNLQLCDNLVLHLEAGAILKASANQKDYDEDKTISPNSFLRYYLLEGRNVRNVTIEGQGLIDGSGPNFWKDDYLFDKVLKPKTWRPVVIYMVDSSNITMRDFSIHNASAFTIWTAGCESVFIDNIIIRNPLNGPNTDGLDIDCCRNVRISNCDIEAGDDCIALKSDSWRLGRMMPCENIAVTNCNLSSTTCAIRIGYEGDAPIRDCIFSNLTMYNCRHGIDMLSVSPNVHSTKIKNGTPIERIIFSNITMREVKQAIFMWAGKECDEFDYTGYIRDVSIIGLQGQVSGSSYIGSKDNVAIFDILLRDIRLVQDGIFKGERVKVPCLWGGDFMPWSLNLLNIKGITMNNFNISKGKVQGDWVGHLAWDNVQCFYLNGKQIMKDSDVCDI
ncbi:MAG: glycosyl hydrolase family 28 protein [Lentisphaeria bacterium]